ncbi:unnamed protein product [Closterium sp. NIES-64]|nr:unnamed protein product [Closterium sp. NIES-64]
MTNPGLCTLLGSLTGLNTTNYDKKVDPTYIGGICNPLANTNGDPHFRGADGTRFDFNGLLDRSFCLLSDRRIHINMGIKGYRPIANLPGTATSLDENTLAAAVEAAANEFKPRHIQELQEEALSAAEVAGLLRMRDNGSLPETEKVADALEREVGRFRGSSGAAEDAGELGGDQAVPAAIQLSEGLNSVQYAKHELEARLLKGKPIRSWIRELQVMWRDATGAQHSAFLKARDGKEQGRGASGFIQWMVIDGQEVAPPFYPGSSISASGGFKLLLAESRSRPGRVEDEFHLKIEGVVDLGVTARVAHPLMQTATEAQAHFNVHIVQLNHTEGIHGVLGQTFRSEASRSHTEGIHGVLGQTFRSEASRSHTEGIHGVLGQTFRSEASRSVRSLRHRLLTRLLREPVDVESSEVGDGLLDGIMQDYLTSGIAATDCVFSAAGGLLDGRVDCCDRLEQGGGGGGQLDGRVHDYLTSGIAASDCAFAAEW